MSASDKLLSRAKGLGEYGYLQSLIYWGEHPRQALKLPTSPPPPPKEFQMHFEMLEWREFLSAHKQQV